MKKFMMALCIAASIIYIINFLFNTQKTPDQANIEQMKQQITQEKNVFSEANKPTLITKYTTEKPASVTPLLLWHTFPGAVSYELEFLNQTPEIPNGIVASRYRIFSTNEIFTNGYYADLSDYLNNEKFYWRVRALDYDGNAISEFSDAEQIIVNKKLHITQKPIINNIDRIMNLPIPLYPVYNWIPIHNITDYEVELLSEPPEIENNTIPSENRIWSKIVNNTLDCYDDFARLLSPGTYYWRVRAIDANGNTIGEYSDTESFVVTEQSHRVQIATFGDSITHGGGALSYSPANYEYSYQTYLEFATLNLGKSGDTSKSMVERFDSDVLPFRPKNLIILCGANSIRAGTSANEIIKDLNSIKTKCYLHNIRPIFLTLLPLNPANISKTFGTETSPNWKLELTKVNAFIRTQHYYIDIEPYFYDENGEMATYLATDGLHPDIIGKKLMAEIINANKNRVLR
ncbi:SGNH/GDSL hydrolase family protein [Anaerosinus massiliensis]|uniref:SGNH/GDSL hydrolase family protein n=1 Tax=Massilibacillus massiliensis TaxID=1806837 RepID=UPI000AB3A475|nr:GDSL-type esterase/lipase family protein [Massilibacillus massiliensis]